MNTDARLAVLEERVRSLESIARTLNNRIVTMEQNITVETRGAVAGAGGVAIAGDCKGGVKINTGR